MFELQQLPYSYDALEPYIDPQTMEIHYSKHHKAYTDKLNDAVKGTEYEGKTIEEIMQNISKASPAIRNNGGGFYNHSLFWSVMGPEKGGVPHANISNALNTSFGSFENFQEEFTKAGITRFGSGWVWLILKKNGTLKITSTANQDNPLMDIISEEEKGVPILCLDVWEHAYYLKYQNKRPDYISAWWNVVDWGRVEELYDGVK